MLIQELIIESRGLLFRSPGDIWKNSQGVEIRLEEIQKFPLEGAADDRQLDQFLEQITQTLKEQGVEQITPVNERKKITQAFAVAVFTEVKTQRKLAFIKWLTRIDPKIKGQWDNNELGDFKYQSQRSFKSRSGLKPANLLPSNREYTNPEQILNDLQGKVSDDILQGITGIVKRREFFFPVSDSLEAVVRDDFGEIITPIMLWQGQISEAESARKDLLGDKPWKSCKITFPPMVNSGLLDSVLVTPDGVRIGISSKGDSGVKASISNLNDGIRLLQSQNSPMLKTAGARKLLHIVDVLIKNKSIVSPLILAVEMDLITQNQADAVEQARDITQFTQDRPGEQMSQYLKAGRVTHTQTNSGTDPLLEKLNDGPVRLGDQVRNSKAYSAENRSPGYRVGYHALTLVANMVCKEVNADPEIGKAALGILNSSPFLQIHLYTRYLKSSDPKNAGVTLQKWNVLFPLDFQGQVYLTTEKAYWNSGQQGRMTFGFR
jgi:hypothetical protein